MAWTDQATEILMRRHSHPHFGEGKPVCLLYTSDAADE